MNLEVFQRVLKAIGEGCPLEGTLRDIVELFREKTGARRVGIWLFPATGAGASAPQDGNAWNPVAQAVDNTFSFGTSDGPPFAPEWPRTGGDPLRPLDSATIPDTDGGGKHKFVGFGLKFHGKPLGVLGVWSEQVLTEEEIRWGRTLAYQAALAVITSGGELDSTQAGSPDTPRVFPQPDLLLGNSPRFQQALERARLVARVDACVLLTGPSGTGKSQLAAFIHRHGPRRKHRFVEVNCGSIAPHLFEAEFFGHVRGAFTGAWRDRLGRFQFADRGTLFLDEVGEIPLELQSRLLRVLQTGMFERVGEDESRRVNVRIIAATNRDLPKMVSEGRFREDLYYRLNAFPIELPRLRDRVEDIPLLAGYLLERVCARDGLRVPKLDEEHFRFLKGLEWEGNIRELEHRLERALILSNGGRLQFQDRTEESGSECFLKWHRNPEIFLREDDLRRLESENLLKVLKVAKGKVYGKGGAAELLGVPPTTVMSRLKNLGLDREVRKSFDEATAGKCA